LDAEESCVVKQHAALVLLNLLHQWNKVADCDYLLKPLIPTNWSAIDNFTQLLSCVFWLPTMSESVKGNDNVHNLMNNINLKSNGNEIHYKTTYN